MSLCVSALQVFSVVLDLVVYQFSLSVANVTKLANQIVNSVSARGTNV